MLTPKFEEVVTGHAEIRQLFKISSIGTIAGSYVLDGVINKESLDSESFDSDLLDYPVYTKPANFRGLKVPEVLLSGRKG